MAAGMAGAMTSPAQAIAGRAPLRWRVGDVKITRYWELDIGPLKPTEWFSEATPANVATIPWLHPHFADAQGRIVLAVASYLLETPTKRIVVDTGIGRLAAPGFPILGRATKAPRDAMTAAGYGPNDIDDVILTHLHFDHVGGATILANQVAMPAYPRARYLVTTPEFAYWRAQKPATDGGKIFAAAVQPLVSARQLDAVSPDHQVTPEVRLISSPGHTPGHASVHIASRGREAVITGDMLHHPVQFAYLSPGMDQDQKLGANTRRTLFAQFAERKTLVIGSHFAEPTAGRVERAGAGYRFVV
jgi:glyoxylase-like metal-dependent hydrolase (beta-lactamase superfamily II)